MMSASTGPILALGAVTVVNQTVFNEEAMDWRIPIATGMLAVAFNLGERVSKSGAETLAWMTLLATLFTRLDPDIPSPVESALKWWDEGGKKKPDNASDTGTGTTPGSDNLMEV